jgi:GntP family gluconate:H+ symporter
MHAFLTLLLAGILVASLSSDANLRRYAEKDAGKLGLSGAASLQFVDKFADSGAAIRLTSAFGEMAGKIGILIALASVIGQCLFESRAASTIVERMLKIIGPRFAPEAMAASSFVIAIPVFFDTVFYLMIPLARSLRVKLGKDYVLFILAIFAGGAIAHSLVPPTPGPLFVAEEFGVEIGTMLAAGLFIGGCTSFCSLLAARAINRMVSVPLRDDADSPIDLNSVQADRRDAGQDQLSSPGLIESLLPIAVPVLLISLGSIVVYLLDSRIVSESAWTRLAEVVGEKNTAITFGAVFAMSLMRYCPADRRATLITRSLAAAGGIILITSAGGAFGAMLRQAGIAEAVGELAKGVPGLMLLPVAFVVTAAIRTLQGSATVAMITAAGVLQGFAHAETLPFHPVYLAVAIGVGSKPISWMTDSGFWIITRMSGMTESEGLKTVSILTIAMGVFGLTITMLCAWVLPGV